MRILNKITLVYSNASHEVVFGKRIDDIEGILNIGHSCFRNLASMEFNGEELSISSGCKSIIIDFNDEKIISNAHRNYVKMPRLRKLEEIESKIVYKDTNKRISAENKSNMILNRVERLMINKNYQYLLSDFARLKYAFIKLQQYIYNKYFK